MGSVDSHSLNIACSTSNDMAPHTEQSRVIMIDQLSSDSLNRLCEAFEVWGLLSSAPHNLWRPANNAYLLDGLQHPKANKLIQHSSSGTRLDFHVFKVNELKVLASHLQAPIKSSDRKQDIVDSLVNNLTAVPNKQAQPVQPALRSPSRASRQAIGFGNSGGYGSQQHSLLAREDKSASQPSRDYTTAANSQGSLATAMHDRQQSEASNAEPSHVLWKQHNATPLPHRHQQPVRAAMRKLFGRANQQPSQAAADVSTMQQQVAQLEKAYASHGVPQQRTKADGQQAELEEQRATLEQQWVLQEQQRAMQAGQWASTEVVKFIGEVRCLHKKGQGQTAPEITTILDRLQSFPDRIQGYEAFADKPVEIIAKGSSEFGCRAGFVVLLRGPEQYLTKGPGYIYVYHIKDVPHEFKVGVCKDLPERRIDSGKLVGRVVDQGKHNNKEYLLVESFAVPHRTLVDEVLKIRLKSWRFHHPDKGDGYTEWFRNILIKALKDHIKDVIRTVEGLYPEM